MRFHSLDRPGRCGLPTGRVGVDGAVPEGLVAAALGQPARFDAGGLAEFALFEGQGPPGGANGAVCRKGVDARGVIPVLKHLDGHRGGCLGGWLTSDGTASSGSSCRLSGNAAPCSAATSGGQHRMTGQIPTRDSCRRLIAPGQPHVKLKRLATDWVRELGCPLWSTRTGRART
jgi:hypothetical protein